MKKGSFFWSCTGNNCVKVYDPEKSPSKSPPKAKSPSPPKTPPPPKAKPSHQETNSHINQMKGYYGY